MKLERTRAEALVKLLRRDAPAGANTASAIEAQLKKTTDAYIVVPEAWVTANAQASLALREFASNLNASSFEGMVTTPPARSAFSDLPPFEAAKTWDLDSTPPAVRRLSRFLGVRTPDIEAAIVMASLKHDIRYYYGGDQARKREVDRAFAADITEYGALLGAGTRRAEVVSSLDEFAVGVGGGAPFQEPYSWSYGLPAEKRNYAPLASGQTELVEAHAQRQMHETLQKLANERFEFSPELQRILTPDIRRNLKALALQLLARSPAS